VTITRDPLDGVDGTTTVANLYHYTDNNPLNKTDPTGMRARDTDFDGSGDDDALPAVPQAGQGRPVDLPTPEQVLDQYIPDWRSELDIRRIYRGTCGGSWGTANPSYASSVAGVSPREMCVNTHFPDTFGSAEDLYRFTVIHEFMHLASAEIFYEVSGANQRLGLPPKDDDAGWDLAFGVNPGTMLMIKASHDPKLPSGAGELAADCLAESFTGVTAEHYWRDLLGVTCGSNQTAWDLTRKIRQGLFGGAS